MDQPAADVSVREANAADADAIGRVQAAAWRTAYRDLLPPERLAALEPDRVAEIWRDAIVRPPSGRHRVLVAVAAGRVVGFVAVAPAEDGVAVGEVATLVVAPDAQRAGHGSRLLNAAVDRLRQTGCQRVVVWVLAGDRARLDFLTGAGFADDGGRRAFAMTGGGNGELSELRLAAALDDAG